MNNDSIASILGEVLWHSITSDPTILSVSKAHKAEILSLARDIFPKNKQTLSFLEVAAYAHTTGYMLAAQNNWNVTLCDISVDTLAEGEKFAIREGLSTERVRRLAADFHELPIPSGAFDVVYIASALHHTLGWKAVLNELIRVTAPGGILVLQNEPCLRKFCFYKFRTNRPESYIPFESELWEQGIAQTVADPYPGSRPETLFGMTENQQMPLGEILQILKHNGDILQLSIDSKICMSKLDRKILNMPGGRDDIQHFIIKELTTRFSKAESMMDEISAGIGYALPTQEEMEALSATTADLIVNLPDKKSDEYKEKLAEIFGGAFKVVLRKDSDAERAQNPQDLLFQSGSRKTVVIGYPTHIDAILNATSDLLPDIQISEPYEILDSFPESDWALNYVDVEGRETPVRTMSLKKLEGQILVRSLAASDQGKFLVLIRINAGANFTPYKLSLRLNGVELAHMDLYQPEAFLLRGEIGDHEWDGNLTLSVESVASNLLTQVPSVSIIAARVVHLPINA